MKALWKIALLVAGLVMGGAGLSAYAQNPTQPAHPEAAIRAVQQTHDIAARLATIKSAKDLSAYMARTPAADSPFQALSPAARTRFLDSLAFSEKGLASFSYADLEAELSPSQIYRLLSLFGLQRTVPLIKGAKVADDTDRMIMAMPIGRQCSGGHESSQSSEGCDHEEYRCVGRGSCIKTTGMICTSNC